jgi:hypothetical protein
VPQTDNVIISASQLTREHHAYHSRRLRELSKSVKGNQRKLDQAGVSKAWKKVEREDLIREQLRKDTLGIDPLALLPDGWR